MLRSGLLLLWLLRLAAPLAAAAAALAAAVTCGLCTRASYLPASQSSIWCMMNASFSRAAMMAAGLTSGCRAMGAAAAAAGGLPSLLTAAAGAGAGAGGVAVPRVVAALLLGPTRYAVYVFVESNMHTLPRLIKKNCVKICGMSGRRNEKKRSLRRSWQIRFGEI